MENREETIKRQETAHTKYKNNDSKIEEARQDLGIIFDKKEEIKKEDLTREKHKQFLKERKDVLGKISSLEENKRRLWDILVELSTEEYPIKFVADIMESRYQAALNGF